MSEGLEKLQMTVPGAIRKEWHKIRDRVEAMRVACKELWLTEDVFNELVAAKAFLWGTDDDYSGFLILQLPVREHGRDLHCWLCYNRSGEPPIAYWDELVEIAAANECVSITFENDRPGFQRHIPGLTVRYLYRYVLE